jgi:hypothetical protein
MNNVLYSWNYAEDGEIPSFVSFYEIMDFIFQEVRDILSDLAMDPIQVMIIATFNVLQQDDTGDLLDTDNVIHYPAVSVTVPVRKWYYDYLYAPLLKDYEEINLNLGSATLNGLIIRRGK